MYTVLFIVGGIEGYREQGREVLLEQSYDVVLV